MTARRTDRPRTLAVFGDQGCGTDRHIDHCTKADPACGAGVAAAIEAFDALAND